MLFILAGTREEAADYAFRKGIKWSCYIFIASVACSYEAMRGRTRKRPRYTIVGSFYDRRDAFELLRVANQNYWESISDVDVKAG